MMPSKSLGEIVRLYLERLPSNRAIIPTKIAEELGLQHSLREIADLISGLRPVPTLESMLDAFLLATDATFLNTTMIATGLGFEMPVDRSLQTKLGKLMKAHSGWRRERYWYDTKRVWIYRKK